ncbi:MAG TPA: methyltransferase domain-containing protein [Sulfurovum sp.]|nr:methyltransferase domain-containing protein [Sulfurovum sp.]
MEQYNTKELKYFSNERVDLIKYIPKIKDQKILEIGAGTCNTLLALKKNGFADFVVGVELMVIENSNQNNPSIDDVIIGNIEKIILKYNNFFDVIILGDVLEHLIDPWTTLKKLKLYLKDDGIIVASIPNFLYYTNLRTILLDADFKYEDSGILDKTHLRFFTKKNIINLFQENSMKVTLITSKFDEEKGKKYFLSKIFKSLHKFFVTQYYIVASKKGD